MTPATMPPLPLRTAFLAAMVLLAGCREPEPIIAPGVEPVPATGFFARRSQEPLRAERADVAVIFIGGFAERVMARFRRLYESTPPLPVEGRQLRAHYAWDGGGGNVFFHSTRRIRRDIEAFLKLNPKADLVLVGHSYGGSAVMDVLRHLEGPRGKVVVVTVDPVSRRSRSHPRQRAAGIDYWINSYCSDYCDWKDSIASIGGAWGECPQADMNLGFPGTRRDLADRRFQHAYPLPLFEDRCEETHSSAYEELAAACVRLRLGQESAASRLQAAAKP